MKYYIAIVLTLFCGCRCQDKLTESSYNRCNEPCYEGNSKQAGVGTCTLGKWSCAENEEPKCVGSGKPKLAECNGLDNDCDGLPDMPSEPCKNNCGQGIKLCLGNKLSTCIGNEGSKETCNNKDDDCDGRVDNVVYESPYCYYGPPETAGLGECRPGFKRCEFGVSLCVGQILPISEICNHKDDDCDGTVDDGTALKSKDIVVCIDNSGSMGAVINKVKHVTQAWANKYFGRADLAWSLIECPGPNSWQDSKVTVLQNFTNVATFSQKVGYEYAGYTGSEPTLDAVYLVSINENPLMLNWRAGADSVMIMFTDEQAQSYLHTPIDANQAADAAGDAGIKVFIFTTPFMASSYSPIDSKSGGKIFNISMNEDEMETELDSIIDVCK